MDKVFKGVAEYGSGLLFYVLGAFERGTRKTAPLALEPGDPRLLLYSIISLLLAGAAFPLGAAELAEPSSAAASLSAAVQQIAPIIALACAYWGILALVIFQIGRSSDAEARFVDVLAAVLRVYPAIFLVAALARLAVFRALQPLGHHDALWVSAYAFIAVHVALLLWRLPPALGDVPWISPSRRRIAVAMAVLVTLLVDVYSTFGPALARAQPQAEEPRPARTSWCVRWGLCPSTVPGTPPGKAAPLPSSPSWSPPAPMAPPPAPWPGARYVLLLPDAGADLDAGTRSLLDQVADEARRYGGSVRIVAHPDATGSAGANLAQRDVEEIAAQLIARGVTATAIVAEVIVRDAALEAAAEGPARSVEVVISP